MSEEVFITESPVFAIWFINIFITTTGDELYPKLVNFKDCSYMVTNRLNLERIMFNIYHHIYSNTETII